MAAPVVPNNIAAALRYGPQTQTSLRRSQYLTDALRQMNASGGENIRSGGELAAKLLATAILQRGANKAEGRAITALKTDQDNENASLIAALRPPKPPEPAAPIAPAVPAPAQPPPQVQPQAALPSVQPQQARVPQGVDPQLDAIVRTVWGEARNEAPEGQSAVASVILNRSKRGQKAPMDVVLERNQFEPWGNPKTRAEMESLNPETPEYQAILRNISPALQGNDITGGADHFYSPTAQSAMGRAPPKWDNGAGRDMGRHRFFALGYGGQQGGSHERYAPQQMAGAQDQAAMLGGQGAPPDQMAPAPPSAPAGPSGGGAAPAVASPPQAAAAGANAWPTWKPTDQQVDWVEGLLTNPRTREQGVAEARKLQAKMAEPAPAKIVDMNGVQFYVSEVPGQGGQPVMIPVPQEAMTQTMTAQQSGLPSAPQGAYVQRDPYGNLKEAPFAPPQGYNAGPNGYSPIAGGPADPTRVQAPPAGYQLSAGQGGQPQYQAIQGGPVDPRSPKAIIEGTASLRGELQTMLQDATKLRRNYETVNTGYGQQNGAGDIAIINGLQRMIDEGVVREGDVALQLKANGVEGTLGGWLGYAQSKGQFTPEIRSKIKQTADSLYRSMNDVYGQRVQGYKSISEKSYGPGAFEYVLPSETADAFGWNGKPQGVNQPPPPNPAAVAGPAGSREAAIVEARKRGLIR
jgi:spore germination cell wall hydrolase CwlJ-like protein